MKSEDKELKKYLEKILDETNKNISVPESLNSNNLLSLINDITPEKNPNKKAHIISFSKKLALPVAAILVIAVSLPLMKNNNFENIAELKNENTYNTNEAVCDIEEVCEATEENYSMSNDESSIQNSSEHKSKLKSTVNPRSFNANLTKAYSVEDIKNAVSQYRVSISDKIMTHEESEKSINYESENSKEKSYFLNLDIPEENLSFSAFTDENGFYSVDISKNNEIKETIELENSQMLIFMEYLENTLYIAYDKLKDSNENNIISCLNAYELSEENIKLKYSFAQDGKLLSLNRISSSEIEIFSEMSIPDIDINLLSDDKLIPHIYYDQQKSRLLPLDNIEIAQEMSNQNYVVITDLKLLDNKYVLNSKAILGQ